ncbi:glycosyltransferase family 2 protein [Maritimibacter sp. HL-12]|uniref:glycosyltransferase family 2 protein n=1 Tax=Maritimibacter sp. HL-12 TaxID=1162418 RepID=UPI000A0F1396|nr:glycosyltransferase family 2 protein [Maritimibacter sp. HL-12]SMH55423.1 glycosyltransferase [Maritimibacter sp. HL-12]
MRITIVTAVFNAQATVADAIGSVAAQSHPDLEHLVIDGGSTDGTLDAIRSCDCDRLALVSEPDDGIYDALNKGISRATGEVVGLVHADDFLAHRDVIKQVAEAFSDPEVDAVYGDLDYVAASDSARIIRHWKAGAFRPARLKWGWMPPHPTLFLRRRVFEAHGLYDTGFRIAADYDAVLRYFGTGTLCAVYLPEVLVKMRVGGESNRSLERIWTKSREDYAAIRRNRVGGVPTLIAKNLSKLPQFFLRS